MLLFAVAKVETLAVGGTAAGFATFLMDPFFFTYKPDDMIDNLDLVWWQVTSIEIILWTHCDWYCLKFVSTVVIP